MPPLEELDRKLRAVADAEIAAASASFFKTGKGQYGEGDLFIGIRVPQLRRFARQYRDLSLEDVHALLASPVHEFRFVALAILVMQYQRGTGTRRKTIFDFYLAHTDLINNWDLVDTSAPYIVGEHLAGRSTRVLKRLARSESLWERRIAIVATFAFIRRGEIDCTFAIAEMLLCDQHNLMHKAVGWALREAGKVSEERLLEFLQGHYAELARTTLRYAIERFSAERRANYLRGEFRE